MSGREDASSVRTRHVVLMKNTTTPCLALRHRRDVLGLVVGDVAEDVVERVDGGAPRALDPRRLELVEEVEVAARRRIVVDRDLRRRQRRERGAVRLGELFGGRTSIHRAMTVTSGVVQTPDPNVR